MFAGTLAALLSAAPLLPRMSLLRPRYGSFPAVLGLLCLIWVLLMRYALPGFGKRVTWAALGICALVVIGWLPRSAGHGWGARFLTPAYYNYVILPTTAVQVAMLLGILTAPVWVIWGRLAKRRLQRPAATPTAQTSPTNVEPPKAASRLVSRRQLIAAAPWIVPGGALLATSFGAFSESRRIVVRRLRIAVPRLPASLEGFRIGQITDIHMARDLTQMAHLERGLSLLASERLDILCATGDLCDEPRWYVNVLRMIAQVPTRHGHFGCLGNHELFLGLDVVRRAYDRSTVQLLEDESVRLGSLRIAGIGYAMRGRSMRLSLADVPIMLDEALASRHKDEPTATVLMAHHPHVYTQLAGRDIALTLSGHTHGGQMGFGQGSIIERFYPYARGYYPSSLPISAPGGEPVAPESQLFVSSGLGHWLPVRLNCPPEVVVIELVSA